MESNTHPNSLVLAGIKQTTSEMVVKNKRVKPEDKVLASCDLLTPTANAFGIRQGVHKNVQCKSCMSHSNCLHMCITLLVTSAHNYVLW